MDLLAASSFDYGLAAENINYMAVLVGAVLSFVVGGIWYNEGVFGKRWQKLVGLKKKDLENSNMPAIFGFAFVLTLVQGWFLSLVMSGLGVVGVWDGLLFGLLVGGAFAATTVGIQYLYAQRDLELYAVDAGYVVLQFAVMAAVLGWWQ